MQNGTLNVVTSDTLEPAQKSVGGVIRNVVGMCCDPAKCVPGARQSLVIGHLTSTGRRGLDHFVVLSKKSATFYNLTYQSMHIEGEIKLEEPPRSFAQRGQTICLGGDKSYYLASLASGVSKLPIDVHVRRDTHAR
jgi:hypothetical protein